MKQINKIKHYLHHSFPFHLAQKHQTQLDDVFQVWILQDNTQTEVVAFSNTSGIRENFQIIQGMTTRPYLRPKQTKIEIHF